MCELEDGEFEELLQALLIQFPEPKDDSPFKGLEEIQLFLLHALNDEKFKNNVTKALRFFTKKNWVFDSEKGWVDGDRNFMDCFDEVREMVATIHGIKLKKPEEEEYNYANEAAQRFAEQRKKQLEERSKMQKKRIDSYIMDSVFNLAAVLRMPIHYLLDNYTYYQFNCSMRSFLGVESYEVALKAAMAGADSKKNKIVHWTTTKQLGG